MAISRILGASLVSDLDRQGVDLQFTTSGNSLVYMDFANFHLGVNQTNPSESLHVNGNVLVANGHVLTSANLAYDLGSESEYWRTIYAANITATNFAGIISTASQPYITSLGTLTGLAIDGNLTVRDFVLPASNSSGSLGTSTLWWNTLYSNVVTANNFNGTLLTADQPYISNLGNITVDSIVIGGNISITGNTNGGVINADELYEANNRVLTSNTSFTVTGDATGTGLYTNIAVTLANTGVTAGVYGSADDEYADRVPKITVDSKGRITNIANVTLTQVGNVTFTDTTVSTVSTLILAPGNSNISVNNSVISNLADPVNAQDAVTKNYFTNILSSTANSLIAGDSLVNLVDAVGAGKLEITIDGNVVANITSATSEFYNPLVSGNISIDGNEITSTGNLDLNATSTGIVRIVGTDAIGIPYGNIALRPANPDIGYFRFNTEIGGMEYWTGNIWTSPGLATISSDTITPDGTSNTYPLSTETTSDGVLVSINGTMQRPESAYTVNGNVITFTETPLATDIIELRTIGAGAMSVQSLSYGSTRVDLDAANVNVAGNFLPQANVAYDIGSDSLRWRDIYLSGNTINLGGARLSTDGSTLNFIPAGSSTAIDLGGDVDPTAISSGTNSVKVTSEYVNVAIDGSNIASFSADGLLLTGGIQGGLPVSNLAGTITIAQGGTNATTATDALNNLLPSGEQSGYVLTTAGAGSYYWASAGGGGGATVGQQLTTLRQANTASSGQTVFNLVNAINYTPGTGQLRIYINGVRQFPDAYSETSSNSYTLSTGVSSGTVVFAEIDAFSSFNNYANLTYASNIGNISAVGLTVQSAIDSLENSKATLASPVFTGNVTAPTIIVTDITQSTGPQTGALTVIGGASFGGNVYISGNLQVAGTETIFNANNLNIADSLIYLADDNSGDVLDIGIVSAFTNPGYQHTGFVRDASDGTWKLFANVVAEPTTTIDFTNATYSNLRIGNLSSVNATLTGNLGVASVNATNLYGTLTGNVTSSVLTVNGQTNLQQISETLNTKTSATGTVTHDFSTGAIWFHSTVSSNFTANFTNVPTTDNRVLSVAIAINQGGTGYYPNAVQIDGVAQTIRWQGNTAPTPGVNRVDIYSYNLMRTGTTWYVLGSATSH